MAAQDPSADQLIHAMGVDMADARNERGPAAFVKWLTRHIAYMEAMYRVCDGCPLCEFKLCDGERTRRCREGVGHCWYGITDPSRGVDAEMPCGAVDCRDPDHRTMDVRHMAHSCVLCARASMAADPERSCRVSEPEWHHCIATRAGVDRRGCAREFVCGAPGELYALHDPAGRTCADLGATG